MSEHVHEVVVVGGGSAGITVASQLMKQDRDLDLAIIEPSRLHFYQPMWTLNGAGVSSKEKTVRKQSELIPESAVWIRDAATGFEPEKNLVHTRSGRRVRYEQLVVAPGIQLDWDAVEGLEGQVGKNGICSNYEYRYVDSTWNALRNFEGGNAVFTMPNTPVKCPGAPQKIVYLADDYFRRSGVREQSELIFPTPTESIFGVDPYRETLEQVVERKQLDVRFRQRLIAVDPPNRTAVFEHLDTGVQTEIPYDLLHVTPPQSAPDFIEASPLSDQAGWVDVDPRTLQHHTFSNVFSLGDASNVPTSKTGAAVRKQAPVVVENLLDTRAGRPPSKHYDGYAACPLVTGYGSVVLAEFDYEGNRRETFPVDQSKERYSMYLVKKHLLPAYYWNGMLKGRG